MGRRVGGEKKGANLCSQINIREREVKRMLMSDRYGGRLVLCMWVVACIAYAIREGFQRTDELNSTSLLPLVVFFEMRGFFIVSPSRNLNTSSLRRYAFKEAHFSSLDPELGITSQRFKYVWSSVDSIKDGIKNGRSVDRIL